MVSGGLSRDPKGELLLEETYNPILKCGLARQCAFDSIEASDILNTMTMLMKLDI